MTIRGTICTSVAKIRFVVPGTTITLPERKPFHPIRATSSAVPGLSCDTHARFAPARCWSPGAASPPGAGAGRRPMPWLEANGLLPGRGVPPGLPTGRGAGLGPFGADGVGPAGAARPSDARDVHRLGGAARRNPPAVGPATVDERQGRHDRLSE